MTFTSLRKLLNPVEIAVKENPFRGRNARLELEKLRAEAENARRTRLLEKYKGDPIASKLTYDQLGYAPVAPALVDFFSRKPLIALTFDGMNFRGRGTNEISGLDIGKIVSESERRNRAFEREAASEGARDLADQLAKASLSAKITEAKANTYDAKHATSKVSAGIHQGRPIKALETGLGNLKFPDFTIKPKGYDSNLNSFKKYIRSMTDQDGNPSRYVNASDEEIERVFFDLYGTYFNEDKQFVGKHYFGGIINYLDYIK